MVVVRTRHDARGASAIHLVAAGHVTLEAMGPRLSKLGDVTHVVEHRLEYDIRVVLLCKCKPTAGGVGGIEVLYRKLVAARLRQCCR